MVHKHSFLNFFFRPGFSGLIILLLLFCDVIAIAQESIPEEFVIGVAFSGKKERRSEPVYYDTFSTSGMNSLIQWAVNGANGNKDLMTGYNVFAVNQDSLEWPGYYANCYYTKWEAEQDQNDPLRVGVKHAGGTSAWWNDTLCWSSGIFVESPDELLIYGPHYRQDNRYKSWAHGDRYDVRYQVRYRMALDNPLNEDPNRPVCNIKVIYKYRKYDSENHWGDSVCIFREKTLRVEDFPQGGHFKYFKFDPPNDYYKYPPQFQLPEYANKIDPSIVQYPLYEDSRSYQGIQFVVDWLIDNPEESGLTLYVDHLEVYDMHWGDDFMRDSITTAQTVQKIREYAAEFSDWSNLKYFLGMDEPWSLDAFTPLRIVDSLLYNNPYYPYKHRLLTVFNPYWSWDNKINGDTLLFQFYRMANPEQLIVDMYPFAEWFPIARAADFEYLRYTFQECHTLQPGFWYMGQGFGEQTLPDSAWWVWRYPTNEEFKASTMLALAHGAKGLLPWIYDSYTYWAYNQYPPVLHYIKGLREEDANITATPIWNLLKNNLVPRLKGKLGNKLLSLNYTSDYLSLRRYITGPNEPPNTGPTVTEGYLTLSEYVGEAPPPSPINFHAGFFSRPSHPLDKYFMLDNLITTVDRWVNVRVANDCSSHPNNRFRNIEGQFDTTFTCDFSIDMQFPAGEGYLFQVAPVVKYGGKLIYPETISSTTTLLEEMVIQNGATLTINSTYNADRDIRIKAGGRIVTTNGGTLKFYNGHRLLVEGPATLSGTSQHRLIIDFVSPENGNGILIDSLGALTISYCDIKNAATGILAKVSSKSFDIQNCRFLDCENESINILGQTPYPIGSQRRIKYCTIENSNYGISAANLSEIVVQQDSIVNTDLGLYLSSVSNAQIISNQINSNSKELDAILEISCGGVTRGNTISGHTIGLRLANSSIDCGGNLITDCLYHAMYIGEGSNVNMRGVLIGNPPKGYPLSGYNHFENNGGYDGGPEDNDGSEIYFYNSSAIMREGCNSIVDDREPGGELINTLLLMNGISGEGQIEISAEYNYWGETQVTEERFGDMIVHLEPYYNEPCNYTPGYPGGLLIIKTSTGEVIDTLYPISEANPSASELELLYAEAEELFVTGDVEASENYYDQIIAMDTSLSIKKEAYTRKYEIGKLLNRNAEYFQGLRNTYSSLSESTTDDLLKKIFSQLSSLCLVAKEEYVPAINEFDEIIQQNPNTEEAVYAEIDALTAALLVEGNDSTLQKGSLVKYSGDYNSKLDGLLRKHFGRNAGESEEEILPTEYTLYQNYPNPFNPATTIKYDLPNTSDVTLIIYDILGRKVKELVNTKQQAGRYEIQFNASALASGVYIYQLIAEKYISSKKMILLK